MKKINLYFLLYLLLFSSQIACTDEHDVIPVRTELHFINVTQSRTFAEEELQNKLQQSNMVKLSPPSSSIPGINVDAIRYHTKDPRGNPVIASGIISYPKNGEFKGVIVGEHYTMAAKRDAPSQAMYTIESFYAFLGYVVISPDYIGLGATADLPQPYLNVKSAGQVSADMLFAAREYMDSIQKPIKKEIYIVGYSEGGAVALSFQKMAEEQYADEIPIKRVIAGGGPYDLTAFFKYCIETDKTGFPCSIPLAVVGLDYGDNLQLDYTKVFQGPLLQHYKEWICSKDYNTTAINKYINSYILSEFMHPDMFKPEMNPEFNKLCDSFKKNSLIDWTPRNPLLLVHGEADTYVPFLNATKAYESFKAKGCPVELVTTKTGHIKTATYFYYLVIKELGK